MSAKFKINEGLQQGDLEDALDNTISIDEYKSKILEDDDSIVVVFFAPTQEAGYDISSFIEKSPYDFLDTEVSAAPDKTGKYHIFAEIKRSKNFIKNLMMLMRSVKQLTNEEEWTFTTYKMAGSRPLTAKDLEETIRIEKMPQLPDVEELPEEPIELNEMEKSDLEVLHWANDEF